ncbi:hypothetical protein HUO13_36625 [Saccharopolyspora erythraea]|uniref:DUF6802 family protein n=1 Tax=Saccharopolyspora erythraea TaxID=1836 RepID=UPI001BAAE6DC|nr:DUF6802 family protein [Saccharopolyspora erythraea]QUH05573.1 hypothetical protein HUO13_36625 [Saccharopolyspora erythraea]
MYIEETGANDGDIKISVEGEEYTAEANFDLDGDGVDETVAVMTDDGYVGYIDENADGAADVMQTVDANGQVVSQARFDAATGDWVAEQPQQHPGEADPRQQGGESMVVDTPEGDVQIGPATEDTNQDGVADTAVVSTADGTRLVTDVDGDGSADQIIDISSTGDVTTAHHTGDGQWTVVEQGRIDEHGQYTPSPAVGPTDDAAWSFGDPEPQAQPEPKPEGGAGRGAGSSHGGSGAPAADSDTLWS